VLAREVEEFVASGGWDQPPQLFALVRTDELVAAQPELSGQVNTKALLTPVAQEPLPEGDLGDALATIMWPDSVLGCALAQEIVVLPPEAEAALADEEDEAARLEFAAQNPARSEARLVAAVLRDGSAACVLRLHGEQPEADQVVEHHELAPNLTEALLQTLRD